MLTPRFTLAQEEASINLFIHAPYARVSETEIEICGNELHFYSKPYHLRLYFSNDLSEDQELSSSYNATEGTFKVCIPKKSPGTFFPDLEMITKLLTPPGYWKVPKNVTEIDSESSISDKESDAILSESFDWTLPQIVPEESSQLNESYSNRHASHKYGFGLAQEGVFSSLTKELGCVIDIENVDDISSEEVRRKRLELEEAAFDEEHYLADLYNDEEIREILKYSPWWMPASRTETDHHFSEAELDVLKELPRLHLEVDAAALLSTFCSLAEFIFGYAYDVRTNFGSHTVESSWTISKLSPTLSCLDGTANVKDTIIACMRRSLIYPLHRSFELSSQVFHDVRRIFSLGRWAILKCLLAVWKLFSNSQDNRYILNDLYTTSFCVWIQIVEEERVQEFAKKLEVVSVLKTDLDLELDIVEKAADFAVKQHALNENGDKNAIRNLEEVMAKLHVDSDDEEEY